MDEVFSLTNDAGLTIRGTITRPKPRGSFPLIVLAGGFFDTAQSPNTREFAKLFLEQGFAVCAFDFTNGFGKSDGRAADITVSQRVRDLEMVVQYCRRRAYVNERKVTVLGIGLGAMAAVAMEAFSPCANGLVLINTPTHVEALSWTRFDEREMMRVRLKRYFHVPLADEPVLVNYTFFEDGQKLDMSRCARNLKTPTLLIATDSPVVANAESQWLYERIPAKREFQILPGIGAIEGRKGVKQIVEAALDFLKRQRLA